MSEGSTTHQSRRKKSGRVPQFHSYCILFSTFQPTITGTVSTVVHYVKHTFGIKSIGKHHLCIIHLLIDYFDHVFEQSVQMLHNGRPLFIFITGQKLKKTKF